MVSVTIIFQVVRMAGPYIFGKILDLLITTGGLLTFQTAFFVVGGLIGVRILSLIIDKPKKVPDNSCKDFGTLNCYEISIY